MISDGVPFKSFQSGPSHILICFGIKLGIFSNLSDDELNFAAQLISKSFSLQVMVLDGLLQVFLEKRVINEDHLALSVWPKTSAWDSGLTAPDANSSARLAERRSASMSDSNPSTKVPTF